MLYIYINPISETTNERIHEGGHLSLSIYLCLCLRPPLSLSDHFYIHVCRNIYKYLYTHIHILTYSCFLLSLYPHPLIISVSLSLSIHILYIYICIDTHTYLSQGKGAAAAETAPVTYMMGGDADKQKLIDTKKAADSKYEPKLASPPHPQYLNKNQGIIEKGPKIIITHIQHTPGNGGRIDDRVPCGTKGRTITLPISINALISPKKDKVEIQGVVEKVIHK